MQSHSVVKSMLENTLFLGKKSGAGIVFSLHLIEKLVESCQCPAPSSPDDMIIGNIIHSIDVLSWLVKIIFLK